MGSREETLAQGQRTLADTLAQMPQAAPQKARFFGLIGQGMCRCLCREDSPVRRDFHAAGVGYCRKKHFHDRKSLSIKGLSLARSL